MFLVLKLKNALRMFSSKLWSTDIWISNGCCWSRKCLHSQQGNLTHFKRQMIIIWKFWMLINKSIKEGFAGSSFQWKSSWALERVEVSCRISVFRVRERMLHSNTNKRTTAASQLCLSWACIPAFVHGRDLHRPLLLFT